MVTPLEQIEKRPERCKSLLGINYEQFNSLVQQAEKQHKQKQQEIEQEKELTKQQKQENKKLASSRIFVEHVIRLIKIFRVATERFRLLPKNYQRVMNTVCGLVRVRLCTLVFQN